MFPLLKYWGAGCLLNKLVECGAEEVIMKTGLGTKIFLSRKRLWCLHWRPETLHGDLPSELHKGLHVQTWWRKAEVASHGSLFSPWVKDVVFFAARFQLSWHCYGFVSQLKHSRGVVDSGKRSDSNSPLGLPADVVTELITKPQLI